MLLCFLVELRGDAPSGDMSEWNGDITATSNGANEQINITLDHLILSVWSSLRLRSLLVFMGSRHRC